MKAKVVLAILVAACGYGAYQHMTSGPSAAEALMVIPAGAEQLPGPDIAIVSPGQDLAEWRQPGRITVFALVSDICTACGTLKDRLGDHLQRRPDTAVRLVDLGRNWQNVDCRRRYGQNVRSIPHVVIYGPDGQLVAADDGRDKDGLKALYKWINAEAGRR